MRTALLTTLLCLLPAAPAAAQPGVFVDPDSPAGKEYAIPLEQARGEASGGAGGAPGDDAAPLFGEGIERTTAAGGDPGGSNGAVGGSGDRKAGASSSGSGGSAEPTENRRSMPSPAAIEATARNSSDGLLTAAIVAAILAAALLAGIALRRALNTE